MSHSRTIARNAAVVGGATLVSRGLGFLRDMVTAYALGAGPLADAFFVAFRIPNLLRRLFGEGSLTMAFVPVYTRVRADTGSEDGFAMARSALIWLTLILGALIVIVLALARPLTALIAPGFLDDPAIFSQTVELVRICFPYVLLVCAMALAMGVLNAHNHFLAPAMAPVALNIALILAALLGLAAGWNVAVTMAWGVLAGGVAQLWMQYRPLTRIGFTLRGPAPLRHSGVKRVAWLMLPTVAGAAVYQVNILVGTLLASFLPHGSISWLYYADRVVQFPLGIFGVAVGTAALPSLSALAAAKDWDGLRQTLGSSMGLTLFISLPAAAGLVSLAEPIIHLLFARGAFGAEDVAATANALAAYSIGLPAIAMVRPLVAAFYAMEDTRTPVKVAIWSMLAYVALGVGLMWPLRHIGLALAVTAAGWLNAVLLWRRFVSRRGAPEAFFRPAAISLLLSLAVGLLALWLRHVSEWLALAAIPFLAVGYIATAQMLGLDEARLFSEAVLGRLARRFGQRRS